MQEGYGNFLPCKLFLYGFQPLPEAPGNYLIPFFGGVQAVAGYEHVLEYADELLAKARARQELPHGIDFSPSTVQLIANSSGFSGQTSVRLTNINSGYTLDTSALPVYALK